MVDVTTPDEQEPIQLPLIWPNVSEVPVLMANVFMVQASSMAQDGEPDNAILTVGQAPPPVLLGTAEEQQAMMGAIGGVAVHTICRVALTRGRVVELIDSLGKLVVGMDAAAAQAGQQSRRPEPEGPK